MVIRYISKGFGDLMENYIDGVCYIGIFGVFQSMMTRKT